MERCFILEHRMARFFPSLLQRACSSQPQTPAKQQMASGAATELISVAQRTDILHQKRGRSPSLARFGYTS